MLLYVKQSRYPFRQWYDYAVPVLASVGSVVVGSVATVFISSKTEPLGAWLESLNRTSNKRNPSAPSAEVAVPLEGSVATTTNAASSLPTIQNAAESGEKRGVGLVVGRGDRVLLMMVLAFSLVFAYLSSLVGSSDLLGCFLGGLAFSGVPGVQRVWARQVLIAVEVCFGCRRPCAGPLECCFPPSLALYTSLYLQPPV